MGIRPVRQHQTSSESYAKTLLRPLCADPAFAGCCATELFAASHRSAAAGHRTPSGAMGTAAHAALGAAAVARVGAQSHSALGARTCAEPSRPQRASKK